MKVERLVISAHLKFHNVGNGLFYSGQLRRYDRYYNFIYDCGATNQAVIDNTVDNYIRDFNPERIDLFMISHLHRDHINGLRRLRNYRNINTVILPYLFPYQRLYLGLAELGNDGPFGPFDDNPEDYQDYIQFLSSPYNYFSDLGIENIVFLNGDSIKTDQRSIEKEYDEKDENYYWWKYLTDNEDEELNILEFSTQTKPTNVHFKLTDNQGTIFPYFFWKFVFYNKSFENTPQLTQFINNYRGLTSQQLIELLSDSDRVRELKNEYLENLGLTDSNYHNSSMIVYHAPNNIIKVGSLLTGDYNLNNGNGDEMVQYYQNEIDKTRIFLIPHHGSTYNWNSSILDPMQNPLISVCSVETEPLLDNRLTGSMRNDLNRRRINLNIVDRINCYYYRIMAYRYSANINQQL